MKRISFMEPRGGLTPQIVSDVLGLVGKRVLPEVVEQWTDLERLLAYDCAMRHHLRASDNVIRIRPWPHFVDEPSHCGALGCPNPERQS